MFSFFLSVVVQRPNCSLEDLLWQPDNEKLQSSILELTNSLTSFLLVVSISHMYQSLHPNMHYKPYPGDSISH